MRTVRRPSKENVARLSLSSHLQLVSLLRSSALAILRVSLRYLLLSLYWAAKKACKRGVGTVGRRQEQEEGGRRRQEQQGAGGKNRRHQHLKPMYIESCRLHAMAGARKLVWGDSVQESKEILRKGFRGLSRSSRRSARILLAPESSSV